MRRRLYLMRHGDVTYFDADGRSHRPDEVGLNEDGKRQAQAAAKALREITFDRVLASNLRRPSRPRGSSPRRRRSRSGRSSAS